MKKLLSLVLCACMLCCLFACNPDSTGGDDRDSAYDLTYKYANSINDGSSVIELITADQCLHYRGLLKKRSDDLTWAYDEIVRTATHLSDPEEGAANVSAVRFSNEITYEQALVAYCAVYFDLAELWNLREPNNNPFKFDDSVKAMYISYSHDIADIPALNEQMVAKADGIVAKCANIKKDIDKISYIYGYMIDSFIESQAAKAAKPTYSSAMEAILKGNITVGCGFANAAAYLLQRAGVWAIKGYGAFLDGNIHAWVIVDYDGVYKYVDLNDDKDSETGIENSVSRFFCFDSVETFGQPIYIGDGVPLPGFRPDDNKLSEDDRSPVVFREIASGASDGE